MREGLDARSDSIKVSLPDGKTIHVQATDLGGEQKIALKSPEFEALVPRIEGIAQALSVVWEKVKPRRATVEFALQVAVESGQLTALLLQGTSEANLKVCLEWGEKPT